MHSKGKVMLVLPLVCLIFGPHINAEDDLKTKIGNDLGVKLKSELQKLTESNIKASEEFYNSAINVFSSGTNANEAFKAQLEELQKIRVINSDNDSVKMIANIQNLLDNILGEIFRTLNHIPRTETEKRSQIQKLIDVCKKKVDDNIDVFLDNVIKEWSKVYSTIPAEEKSKNEKYEKVNNLLETAAKTENDPKTQGHEKPLAFMRALREVSDLFGYTAWSNFLKDVE